MSDTTIDDFETEAVYYLREEGAFEEYWRVLQKLIDMYFRGTRGFPDEDLYLELQDMLILFPVMFMRKRHEDMKEFERKKSQRSRSVQSMIHSP